MIGVGFQIRHLAGHLGQRATDLVMPPRCTRCGVDLPGPRSILLCSDCQERLSAAGDCFCGRCGAWAPPERGALASCGSCRRARFGFDSVIPLGPYRDALRDVVLSMKHAANESLSAAVGQLLAARRGGLANAFDADFVVPVPMYWGRRIWRGVNSAQVLAEELGRLIQIPVLSGVLARKRNTYPQKDLGTSERFRNVRGAFALSRGYGLGGARALVVDDILTTGATCSEVAKTLKKGGVKAVAAVVVGRAGTGT